MKKHTYYALIILALSSCSKSSDSSNNQNDIPGNYSNRELPYTISVSKNPSGLYTINAISDPLNFDFIFNLTFDSVNVASDYSFTINEYGVDKKSNNSYKTTGSGTFNKDGVNGRMYIFYTISPTNSKAFGTFTKN